MTWFDVSETLPPLDIPIIALWADEKEYQAVLRDTPEAIVWEVEGEPEGLPVAWRWAGGQTRGLLRKNLSMAWWMPAMAMISGLMFFAVSPILSFLVGGAILAMWLFYALIQSVGEAVAMRRGVVLGAIVAMTPTLLALVVGLFFIIRVLRTP